MRGSLDQGELPRGSDPEDDSGRMSQSLPDTQESVGSRGHGVSKKWPVSSLGSLQPQGMLRH